MTERPILFSAQMVRAILAGQKVQTRRTVKPWQCKNAPLWSRLMRDGKEAFDWEELLSYGQDEDSGSWGFGYDDSGMGYVENDAWLSCPFGKPGDRLYVRESYYQRGHWEPVPGVKTKGGRMKWRFVATGEIRFDEPEQYRKGRHHKDPQTVAWHRRLARFMPRSASRILLEVKAVRVERLQDISEADARAEGVEPAGGFMTTSGLWTNYGSDGPSLRTPSGSFRSLWGAINGAESWAANPWVWVVEFERVQ